MLKEFIRGYRGDEVNFLERLSKYIELAGKAVDLIDQIPIYEFKDEKVLAFTVSLRAGEVIHNNIARYRNIFVVYIYYSENKELIWMRSHKRTEIKRFTDVEFEDISDLPMITGSDGGVTITRDEIYPRMPIKSANSKLKI